MSCTSRSGPQARTPTAAWLCALALLLPAWLLPLHAQTGQTDYSEPMTGRVTDAASGEALAGATVLWVETGQGTATDAEGRFELAAPSDARAPEAGYSLRFSMVGYQTQTYTIHETGFIPVALEANDQVLDAAVVEGDRQSASLLETVNLVRIGTEELQRAACCNLSESFETTADVDVAFTDAVSGAKQVRMLGLDGRYVQILNETRPGVRGLALPFGLTYIPGTWMSGISISKGPGSVVNGYEGISGSINVDYHMPRDIDKFSINAYGNIAGRAEVNAHGGGKVGGKAYTASYLHGHFTGRENDRNNDGFLDIPTGTMGIAMHRWQFVGPGLWRGQIGVEGVLQALDGGQVGAPAEEDPLLLYDFALRANRYRAFAKLGRISPDHPGRSTGFMAQATYHDHETRHGDRYAFAARQRSGYANLIQDLPFGEGVHKLRFGASIAVDEFRSDLTRDPESDAVRRTVMQRTEIVPGAFAEYRFEQREWSLVAGLRVDHHNLTDAGFLATPRLHLRKCWNEQTTWRISAGSGFRTVNPVVEFSPWLNSARDIRYPADGTLLVERGYNAGTGLVHQFKAFGRSGQLRGDYYATVFTDRVVADLDRDPDAVYIGQAADADGRARSLAAQIEAEYEVIDGFVLRLAGKLEDVRVQTDGRLQRQAFVPPWRTLASLAWTSDSEFWKADLTVQGVGAARLPEGQTTPSGETTTEAYPLVLAQVSRQIGNWRIYAGTENAFNYRQPGAIRGASDPYGPDFDAASIWGPILGRNVYAGVTFTIGQ